MPRTTLLVVSLFFGLVACDRQPTAPLEETSPAFNWINNPYTGNLRITRFMDGFAACWSDATNGLRACHSTVPLGDGTETDCGPQAVLDPVPFQWVGVIDPIDFFSSWIHQNARGKVWITVRDLTQPGACFGSRLIAEGWGTAQNNDNDLFGAAPDDKNANAWRFAGRGALTTPAGAAVSYTGHIQFVFSNVAGFKELGAQVSVK